MCSHFHSFQFLAVCLSQQAVLSEHSLDAQSRCYQPEFFLRNETSETMPKFKQEYISCVGHLGILSHRKCSKTVKIISNVCFLKCMTGIFCHCDVLINNHTPSWKLGSTKGSLMITYLVVIHFWSFSWYFLAISNNNW